MNQPTIDQIRQAKAANVANIFKKLRSGSTLNSDERNILNEMDGEDDETVFPVYDSMKQASSSASIPIQILKKAKRDGCPAFKSNRVYIGEFIAWHFVHEVREGIDIQEQEGRIKKAEADRREREEKEAIGELVRMEEVERLQTKLVVAPLRQALKNMPGACAKAANPDDPRRAEDVMYSHVENVIFPMIHKNLK